MDRIAILVLGCASEPYGELIDTIRSTWGQKQLVNVDVYYVFGLPQAAPAKQTLERVLNRKTPCVSPGSIYRSHELLVAGCQDNIAEQEDCLLQKRLIAFGYLASLGRYDYVYNVCASSYVDLYELTAFVAGLEGARNLAAGPIGIDLTGQAPYVSGASMLLSIDIAGCLAHHRDSVVSENKFGFRDDVAIGGWIADHLSGTSRRDIMKAIEERQPMPPDSVFANTPGRSVDFVLIESASHRPRRDAFHYHFHSSKARDMAAFHERYFLHQSRNLWASLPTNRRAAINLGVDRSKVP